jgi:hypothetical protein
MRRLALMHLVGNALTLWLGYYWLGLAESRASTLAWSGFVALLIIAYACWLHGVSSAYFAQPKLGPAGASGAALRHLPVLLLVAAVAGGVYWILPVKKGWWIARWIVMPWLVAPLFAAAAADGWRVLRGFAARLRNPLHWIATPLLVFVALWLPMRLLGWIPSVSGFWMEMTSFVLRAAAAYLLFTGAWLLLGFVTSGGRPSFNQPKTASLP